MATTITLKLKNKCGGTDRETHEVEDIDLFQFQQMMKILNDIFSALDTNSPVRQLIEEMFSNSVTVTEEKYEGKTLKELKQVANELGATYKDGITKEQLTDALVAYENQQLEKEEHAQMVGKMFGAFQMLTVELPEHAIRLLSILSAVELDKLKQQKLMAVMDIYDAVMEENDVEGLISRAKKSLALTKAKITFTNFGKKIAGVTNPA